MIGAKIKNMHNIRDKNTKAICFITEKTAKLCDLCRGSSHWVGGVAGAGPRRGGSGRIAALRQFFSEFCFTKLHNPPKVASLERGGDFPLIFILVLKV
jgi:hypothetical protein